VPVTVFSTVCAIDALKMCGGLGELAASLASIAAGARGSVCRVDGNLGALMFRLALVTAGVGLGAVSGLCPAVDACRLDRREPAKRIEGRGTALGNRDAIPGGLHLALARLGAPSVQI